MLSRSSRRPCSQPLKALIEAYLAVPVNFLFVQKGICLFCFELQYFFDKPQSRIYTIGELLPRPIKKLSGFISRCIIFLL